LFFSVFNIVSDSLLLEGPLALKIKWDFSQPREDIGVRSFVGSAG
jgi:hypothetical protein